LAPILPPGHCSPAPRHHLPATTCPPPTDLPKSGSFACWIPHYLDLSPNVPVTNTQSIWLRFGAFLSPSASSLHFHWPLVTGHWSLATGHWPLVTITSLLAIILWLHTPRLTLHAPPPPAGSGRARTLPRWLLPSTDRRIPHELPRPQRRPRIAGLVLERTAMA